MRLRAGSAAESTVKVHAGHDELYRLVHIDRIQFPLENHNQYISLNVICCCVGDTYYASDTLHNQK